MSKHTIHWAVEHDSYHDRQELVVRIKDKFGQVHGQNNIITTPFGVSKEDLGVALFGESGSEVRLPGLSTTELAVIEDSATYLDREAAKWLCKDPWFAESEHLQLAAICWFHVLWSEHAMTMVPHGRWEVAARIMRECAEKACAIVKSNCGEEVKV